jgi:hypothetical protein
MGLTPAELKSAVFPGYIPGDSMVAEPDAPFRKDPKKKK